MTHAARAGWRSLTTALVGLLTFSLVAVPGAQAVPSAPDSGTPTASGAAGPLGAAPDSRPEPVRATTDRTAFVPDPRGGQRRGGRAHDTSGDTGAAGDALLATADVTGFGVVGVTWTGGVAARALDVEVRTSRTAGATSDGDTGWGPWEHVAVEPSPQGTLDGTEPVVVGDVAQVQARVTGPAAGSVRDLALSVVDPGTSPADDDVPVPPTATSPHGAAVAAVPVPDRPTIVSRAAWGADESIMSWTPRQGDVRAAAVHHTAGTNSYSEGQVPGIIRGIYAYHAQTRGWGDIGYNFVVDKFGRLWEGRAGGITAQTIGAHAQGYNSVSTGVSVLGNYETATVSNAAVGAVVDLLAWKLALHGVPADGSTTVDGTPLAHVFGHRDVGYTACPGRTLYEKLGEIRRRAAAQQAAAALDVPDGTFVASPNGTLALVEQGRKHKAYCSVARAYGTRCDGALPVTWEQWAGLTTAARLQRTVRTTDGRLFWIGRGSKREAFDAESLERANKSSPVMSLPARALRALPHGRPIVRPAVIVVNRSTGRHRLVIDGRKHHGFVGTYLRRNTPLGDLDTGYLDRASVRRMPSVDTTTGVVGRADRREFLLTTQGLVRTDGTGSLLGSATWQDWGRVLKNTVPRDSRWRSVVAVRQNGSSQVYLVRDGVLHPVTAARARELNDGVRPPVHVILKVTKRQLPEGPPL
ncbi:N-acetylmuramoyl-L-alanine amidase [Isoptericola sp. b515]|uniref:N-acetylmuramoyl-L-alanine amidase n=1 Tax=Isoptericola sp. b515 TaxID=3064652 RepID=UPI0027137925|nr:N-acetylmuramoyl-L-alanine amidase [Isoptericola sp. b515]MDO8147960.1 N-acetylmuramoyl-L-alanine amidase [Isoptericola sp. b515]